MKIYIGYNAKLLTMIAGLDGYDKIISRKKNRHGSYELKVAKSVECDASHC